MTKAIKPEVGKFYDNHVYDLVEILSIDEKTDTVKLRNHQINGTMFVRLSKLILRREVKKNKKQKLAKVLPYRGPKF